MSKDKLANAYKSGVSLLWRTATVCMLTGFAQMVRRYGGKPDQFWWETFGILPEERSMLG